MICERCSEQVPVVASRGSLTVRSEPWYVTWNGQQVRMRPEQAEALFALVRRRHGAGFFELGPSVASARWRVWKLRKSLTGLPLEIESIPEWGYRLQFKSSTASPAHTAQIAAMTGETEGEEREGMGPSA